MEVNLIQVAVGKKPFTSFFTVVSTNMRLSLQNFFIFGFNLLTMLMKNVQVTPSANPKLFNLNQEHPTKTLVLLVSSL